MKKIINYIILGVMLMGILGLFSCSNDTEVPEHNLEVIFKLENGTYKNSQADVIHYYNFKENQKHYIYTLSEFTRDDDSLIHPGYVLEGWYQVKNEDGTYDNKWDFDLYEVDKDTTSLTLYANWIKEVHYTYELRYLDEEGNDVSLGSYDSELGAKFSDFKGLADRNYGYTRMSFLESGGYTDADGNPWNSEYTHPGDECPNVLVYVKYLYGDYSLVSNKEELLAATGKSIYLLNDLDLEGASLSFNNYKKEFVGNNHTISNFVLSYQADKSALKADLEDTDKLSLYISLFGNTKDAIIKDVNFNNVTISIDTLLKTTYKIYLAGVVSNAQATSITNVSFTGTYKITRLPSNMEETSVIIETTKAYTNIDEDCVVSNNNINITKENN